MTETIKEDYYRSYDKGNSQWIRHAFWTKASQVECDDGDTVETKVNNLETQIDEQLTTKIAELQSNFQAGVDSIYNAIRAQGTTPASKSLSDVKNAIATLSKNRYNAVTVSTSVSGPTVTATLSNGKKASATVKQNGTVTVTPSGGSGNQTIDITDGWTTAVTVNRTNPYNAGYNAGQNSMAHRTGENYTGDGLVGGQYYHIHFPTGWYNTWDGASWAPEVRIPVSSAPNTQIWKDAYSSGNSAGYNSGYSAGYSAGKSANSTQTISVSAGGHGGVNFAVSLTVNSNGLIHVNSVTKTGEGGEPYNFGNVGMGLTVTGTDGGNASGRA